jgi:hypothetical protein
MRRRPRLLLIIAGVIALAAAVTASTVAQLSVGQEEPGCPDQAYGCAQFMAGEPVQVGLLATMSGPLRHQGREAARGARLALHRLGGELAGRPLQVLIHDDRCTPDGAALGARELASDPPDEPPVVAVVAWPCARGIQPATQILSDSGITLVTASSVPVSFEDPPRSFLVRLELERRDRAFDRLYRARYGGAPTGNTAQNVFQMTTLLLDAARMLAVPGAKGDLLVPRLPLFHELSGD